VLLPDKLLARLEVLLGRKVGGPVVCRSQLDSMVCPPLLLLQVFSQLGWWLWMLQGFFKCRCSSCLCVKSTAMPL
jgi:hypothetical protein